MKLFEPGRIGKLRVKNRIVMAPMGTRFEEPDGRLSQRGIDYYVARAKGGTGLIITGSFGVVRRMKGPILSMAQPLIDDRMYVNRLNELGEDRLHHPQSPVSMTAVS
jgi:2-enoate reductase